MAVLIDIAKVAHALPAATRPAFVDWARTGWLQRVGIDGGHGLLRKEYIEKTGVILEALAGLAAGLEQVGRI